jgi:predicted phage terminase large subunit-like protein
MAQINNMNAKEFDKRLQELIESIVSNVTPFENDTPEKKAARIKKAMKDYFYFAETYFPHYIKFKFGRKHRKMMDKAMLKGIHAIAAHRFFGKTTNLAIIYVIWRILNGMSRFVIAGAEDETLAANRLKEITTNIEQNQRLKNDFVFVINGPSADLIINKVRLLARGYKQPVRGLIYNGHRPDYIIIDDLESHLSTSIRIANEKLKFVMEECYGAFFLGDGTIVWLGNLTHQNSALALFKKKCDNEPAEQRSFMSIPAMTLENGKWVVSWPEAFTLKQLEDFKITMGSSGFERHMQMNPIVEGVRFKYEWLIFEELPPKFDRIVTYCDPSLSSSKSADYKAIITLGSLNNKIYLLDCWIRQATIDSMINYLYQLDQEYKTLVSMEANLWQRVLWEFIPEISKKYGYYLPVNPVNNTEKKELRIERIQPLFEWGKIIFPKHRNEDINLLIDQLLGFPDWPNDDGPDALAGASEQLKMNHETSYTPVGRKKADFSDLI